MSFINKNKKNDEIARTKISILWIFFTIDEGWIISTILSNTRILYILAPSTVPKAIPWLLFIEAIIAVVNSGKEVPIAIKDSPITLSETL